MSRVGVVFKTVPQPEPYPDLELKADVFGGASGAAPRPVVIDIHGGALMYGSRDGGVTELLGVVRQRFLDAGFIVASIDYRLAPETKLAGIVQDVCDAYDWLRREGPQRFGADPDRIVIMGGSAGGFLTRLAAYKVEPRPPAAVCFWGYGNILNDWVTKPYAFYRETQPLCDWDRDVKLMPHEIACDNGELPRGPVYLAARQHGLWSEKVTGWDPTTEAETYRPYIPEQNITALYPPMFLVHGEQDTDVPCEESVTMAAALKKHGVDHELMILPGEHGIPEAGPEKQAKIADRILSFVKKYTE